MKKLIKFKKQRELGDILTDTFGFIRNEFKPFLTTVLQISGPYLVMFLLSMAFYTYTVGDIFNFSALSGTNSDILSPLLIAAALLIFSVSAILTYTIATSAVLYYIKSYSENEGVVNVDEVKQHVKQTFWGFLVLNFVKWIVIIVSALFCLLPMFYFIVPMTIVLCIFVFENKDVSDSFSDSFKLIKDEYWITFATILVIGIIVTVASYAFGLPASIYSIAKMGIFSGEMDPANMNVFADPILILLNVFSYLFQFLLNFISIVGAAFIYFNLNEKKNFTGTMEQIQSLGNTNN